MKHTSHFVRRWSALLLASLPLWAFAAGDPAVRIREMQSKVVSATVIVLPPRTAYLTERTEADLPKFGCTTRVSDQRNLTNLLDLLNKAEIKQEEEDGKRDDLRIGITLVGNDRKSIKLLFEGIRRQDGLVNGRLDDINVVASPEFPEALRAWAAGQEQSTLLPHIRCGT